jgi:hypothetical protein
MSTRTQYKEEEKEKVTKQKLDKKKRKGKTIQKTESQSYQPTRHSGQRCTSPAQWRFPKASSDQHKQNRCQF